MPDPAPPQSEREGRLTRFGWTHLAWTAVVLGAVLRLVWVVVVHPPYDFVFSDMQGYVARAMEVVSGEPLPRSHSFYPPGTHLLLAAPLELLDTGPKGLRGAALLWWALSSLIPLFAWRMARRLLTEAAAAVAAVLVALYPPLIFYAGFFSSETPSLALLLGALWLGYVARDLATRAAVAAAAGAGVLGAAAIANRPQFLLNLAVVGLPLLWRGRGRPAPALALVLAGALALVPVIAYNSEAAGKLTGLSENGGVIFFQAHCDVHLVTAGSPERGNVFAFGNPVAFELDRGKDFTFPDREVWDEGFFYGEGFDCIRDDGLGHVGRLARNLIDATAVATPFPLGDPPWVRSVTRAVNLGYSLLLPLIVIGAILLLRRRRSRGEPPRERELLWHMACVVPVLAFFASEPRYRILYDVFGLMIAASLAMELGGLPRPRELLRRRRSTSSAPSRD